MIIETAEEILKIKKCGNLFEQDKSKIRSKYLELSKIYHPDINKSPLATQTFAHINILYDRAMDLISKNEWESEDIIYLQDISTKQIHKYDYIYSFDFELGKAYVSKTTLIYLLDTEHKVFYDNYLNNIKSIKYANSNMEAEFKRYIPNIISTYITDKKQFCIVLSKTEEVIRLSDLLSYFNNNIDTRHSAWITSRLLNICCFLNYNNLVHNGLTPENIFISPAHHSIMVYGGWWYASKNNSQMIGISKEIYDILSIQSKTSKLAAESTDIESVKYLLRKLLNNNNKSIKSLMANSNINQYLKDYALSGYDTSPIQEFQNWSDTLQKAFGPRKFVEMAINYSDFYNKIKIN